MAEIIDHDAIKVVTQDKQEQGKLEDVTTVLVTGYGPFIDRLEGNSSWDIASTLPSILPATRTHPHPIRIVVYPWPIRVAYHQVLRLVPELLENVKPDIVLHIGLAAGRDFFTMEYGAHRAVFGTNFDVDGRKFSVEESDKIWKGLPDVLKTGFDVDDLWLRWRAELSEHDIDVRPSPDAGNFLCGFIYYTTMAHFAKAGDKERPVMFMHTPHLRTEKDISQGREAAKALIRALDDSRRKKTATRGSAAATPFTR